VQLPHCRLGTGVEHQHRGSKLLQQRGRQRPVGDVAQGADHAEPVLDLGQALGIARHHHDLDPARHQGLDHAQAEATAAAGDDGAVVLEVLHKIAPRAEMAESQQRSSQPKGCAAESERPGMPSARKS
jgi:hypothetical protein